MISVPIIMFVIGVLSLLLNIILIAYLLIGRNYQKKEYYEYLEEEYGKKEDK